jgi:hypothetical protein
MDFNPKMGLNKRIVSTWLSRDECEVKRSVLLPLLLFLLMDEWQYTVRVCH